MNKESNKKMQEAIRGQRAAVETYKQVMQKVGDDANFDSLREVSSDHIRATQYLVNEAKEAGAEIPEDSGAWGAWAKFSTGVAKTFGDTASLKMLREGEIYGKKMFQDIAEDDDVHPMLREKARNYFIPLQTRHIECIDRLIEKTN